MPTVQSVGQNVNPNSILTLRNTGYAALGALSLTTASAMIKSPTVRKAHKPFAYLTAVLTLIHVVTAILHRRRKSNS